MCRNMNIPSMNFRLPGLSETRMKQDIYNFSIAPPIYKAMVDLIAHKEWTRVVYMYDKEEGNEYAVNLLNCTFDHVQLSHHVGTPNLKRINDLLQSKYNIILTVETWPVTTNNIVESLNKFHQSKRIGAQRIILDLTNSNDVRQALNHLKFLSKNSTAEIMAVHYMISNLVNW